MAGIARNMMNRLQLRFRKCAAWVVKAIVHELPLFCVTLLLWGQETVRNYEGLLHWDDNLNWTIYIGRLLMVLFVAFLFSASIYIIRYKRTLRTILYALVLLTAFLTSFLRELAGMELCGPALQMLMDTNAQEASSFFEVYVFSSKSAMLWVLLFVSIVLIFFVERWWAKHREIRSFVQSSLLRVALPLLVVAGLLCYATYTSLLVYAAGSGDAQRWGLLNGVPDPHDPVAKMAYAVRDVAHMQREVEAAVEHTVAYVSSTPAQSGRDSLNLIVVLGESHIRSHSSLYGYPLPTSPYMEKEKEQGNLFVFNDVVAPAPMTIEAVRQMFFTATIGENEWFEGVYFPAVFRSAGYAVTLLDNQMSMYTGAERTGEGYKVLNAMYHPKMSAVSYDKVNARSYDFDGDLLAELPTDSLAGKLNLVVLHLKGQHFDAKKMYPKNKGFNRFRVSDYAFRQEPWMTDEKRQRIADYDNATLYNDYVIEQVINRYRTDKTVVVYLSDHGEEVYDYRDQWGRTHLVDGAEQTALYYRVPFMIWLSDGFKTSNPEIVNSLQKASSLPFEIDDLPQCLFGLAALKTPLYKSGHDPLNDAYKPKRRLLIDGRDFDQVVR